MNVLSKLFGTSKEAPNKNLVTVSPGQFSIIRTKESPKGQRELIVTNAELNLLKTTREFLIQLQVRDLNKEEDKSEDDDLAELSGDSDNTYLVHPDIKIGYTTSDGQVVILWKDLEGDEGDYFEFKCSPNINGASLDEFDKLVCESLYAQKNGSYPDSSIDKSELEKYTHDYQKKDQNDELKPAADDKEGNVKTESNLRPFTQGRIIEESVCDLCAYDSVKGQFVSPIAMRNLKVVILDLNDYNYFLEIRDDKQPLLGTPITNVLNQYIDLPTKSIVFNYVDDKKSLITYLLRFKDSAELKIIEKGLSIAQYEHNNRERWSDMSDSQQDYLISAISGMNMNDDDEYDDVSPEESTESEEEELFVENNNDFGDEKNSALEIGHANDRSYVVRGNKIGVFKNTGTDLEFSTTINDLQFDPAKIMLHERDRALVLKGEKDPSTLFKMDLETGQIVNEWKTKADINDFNPISKFAQTTDEATLYGVGNSNMFKLDPRMEKTVIDPQFSKKYKSNYGFLSLATTEKGYVVTGDRTGQIRLYEKVGSNAKTLIPGLGDPIIGIDVTSDGRFVLATCEGYILLLNTVTKDHNGFTHSWPTGSKPLPKSLRISPENAAYMQQKTQQPIKFTPARFNAGPNTEEATIVSSTGPYLVTWSLKKVLRGERDSYKIKQYTSNITAENFQFGTDERVIVSLEDNINMVSKNALRSPDEIFKAARSI